MVPLPSQVWGGNLREEKYNWKEAQHFSTKNLQEQEILQQKDGPWREIETGRIETELQSGNETHCGQRKIKIVMCTVCTVYGVW
jgi:hypothetical protein